jgi:hypothetical protein
MCGKSQWRSGTMIREECWDECESLEPKKIKDIQPRGRSQYLVNESGFDTVIGNWFAGWKGK